MRNPLLLDLPDSLQSPRLLLRPPRPGDGAVLHEAIAESLGELRQFLASLPWVAAEPSVDGSEAWARQAQANVLQRKDFPFLLFGRDGTPDAGRLVGVCGLHRTDWAVPKSEVGYWCRTSAAGRGYITEAVQALTRFAFGTFGVVRLELVTDEANAASRRVAERCGFALEGVLQHERRAPDGSLRNTCVYARCDAEG